MSNIIRKIYYDSTDDTATFYGQQDVTYILEANKAQYNDGIKAGRDLRKVASIPLVVVEELIKKGIFDTDLTIKDRKAFLRWINDSENRFFKTSPETV